MPQYMIFLPLVVLLGLFAANIKNKGFYLISTIVSCFIAIAFGLYVYLKMDFFGAFNEMTYVLICSASIFFLAYISITPLIKK